MSGIAKIVDGINHRATITQIVGMFQGIAKRAKLGAGAIASKTAYSGEAGRSVKTKLFVGVSELHDLFLFVYRNIYKQIANNVNLYLQGVANVTKTA